ncbi:hypothetical protein Shyd_45500 [Streptomyces hydrogenans]|uniref:Uncharacterized protein n=1 Tax=Streptomyces hydrogenans TaxID=1873719 RepID=A0ABQ3PDT1_9ACTN|nr:hypothetical protein Shyd_45500 [Streptomyces hydrogenans]
MPLTTEEAVVAGASEVSCWTRVAVPPPIAAAAMATAAIRPTPRLARRRETGPAGTGPAAAYAGSAGGGVKPPPDPDGHTVVPGSVVIGRVGSYGGRGG